MTDSEIDALLAEIEAILRRGYLLARAEAAMYQALDCIRGLRARRNELQQAIDAEAGFPNIHLDGEHPGTKSA
jgi:hypothetical protein